MAYSVGGSVFRESGAVPDIPRIAYVDDDADIRKILELSFKTFAGIGVDTFSEGENFQKEFRIGDYDILMFDVMMPNITGLDLTKWVRQKIGDKETTIILLTAKHFDDVEKLCREMGISGLIQKPFSPPKLHTQVIDIHKHHAG